MIKHLIVFLLFISAALAAQQSPSPPTATDVPTREDVLRFITVAHVKQQMATVVSNLSSMMVKQITANVGDMLKKERPDVTEEEIQRFSPVIEKAFAQMNADEMVELLVPLYQKYYKAGDLKIAIQFYEAPAGQRILEATSRITPEAMQVGNDYGQQKMAAFLPQLKEQIAAIAEDILKAHPEQSSKTPSSGASSQESPNKPH